MNIIERFVEAFMEVSGLRVEAQANEAAEAEKAKAEKENAAREKYAAAMERVVTFKIGRGIHYDYETGGWVANTAEDIIAGLAGIRKLVANDLASEVMAKFVYDPEVTSCERTPEVPYMWLDDDGKEVLLTYRPGQKVPMKEKVVEVDNTKMTLIACPGMDDRFIGHTVRKSALCAEKMNGGETPKLYKNFELLYPGGNRHKLVDAFVNRNSGTMRVYEVDDSELFEKLGTDGAFWYMKDGRKVQEVSDWRIAVIFSIRKMEMALEKEVKH